MGERLIFLRRAGYLASVIAALLVACTIVLAAQSQPPSPRPGNREGNPPQQQTAPTHQVAPADQRGTETTPVVVKVLPPQKTQEEAAQEKAERQDQSAANWWLVRLTGLLAVIGAIQTVVFGVQAYRLKQTIVTMDQIASGQTADMRASINEATRAATAMEGIAKASKVTADAAKLSADTARDTLYLTQSADVQMADTIWNQPSAQGVPETIITIVFKNFGHTAARNVMFDVTLGIPGRPFTMNEAPSPPVTLAAQQVANVGFRPLWQIITNPEDLAKIVAGIEKMRLHGSVSYDDVFGRHHETTFGSVYIERSTSFKIDRYDTKVTATKRDQSEEQT
jgi:hypothetical protein